MKRFFFILILTLSLFAGKVGAQCVTVAPPIVTICQGSTLADLGGTRIDGTTTIVWSDNVGGIFSPNANNLNASWNPPSTFHGTATLTLTATAGCTFPIKFESFVVTVTALPVATFSYTATPYCSNNANPFPTFNGGGVAGTFSSTTGLVFANNLTGEVDLSASAAGIYTVTNTIAAAGGCSQVTATSPITITTLPAATISYAGNPFCKSIGTAQLVTRIGTSGGTYSANTGGLTINASTGAITPGTSTAGNYIVTYTIGAFGGCGIVTATTSVTITSVPIATFSYTASPYCSNEANPFPTFSGGGAAGIFSSTAGLIFINSLTGEVNLAASTAGTYTVTNTIAAAGGCSQVTATSLISITALPAATISYAGTPFCKSVTAAQPVSRTGTAGGTYSVSPGGLTINASTGAITPSTSTAGIYTVTYTLAASGGCGLVTATTSVTITSVPIATFSYTATPYCSNEANPLPTFSGGGAAGIFSSTAGLIFINSLTGEVNLAASTAGTYTITNTIAAAGGCSQVTATSPITITALPAATISYAGNPFCKSVTTAQAVTRTGTTGGIYSASPGGLTINSSTGAITPGTSTAGIYTVTYTLAASGGCGLVTATTSVTITSIPVATFSYTASPYCSNEPNPLPVFSGGGAAGIFSSTAGLIFINSSTGEVNLAASTAGTYTVTNTIPAAGGCSLVTATSTITITTLPAAVISYAGTPFCKGLVTDQAVTRTGSLGGTYSASPAGLTINSTTGAITPNTSTAGNYVVTYTLAASGGCGIVTATTSITITAVPLATISYTGSPWCGSSGVQNVTLAGTTGGTYSGSPAGLSINTLTGAITPGTSTAGTYTVIYTIASSGGCGVTTAATSVTVLSTPSAPIVGTITQTTCTVATGSVVLSGLPSAGWILTRSPGNVTTSGLGATTTISSIPPGIYTYTVTNLAGCISLPSANVVIITQPASPAAPVQSVDCSLGSGHAVVTVTSPTGAGLEYNLNGGPYQTSPVFASVSNNSCLITVRNAAGCITFGAPFSVSCGCVNPPAVSLGSSTGSVCGTTAVTVSGNIFGGSATSVTIASNGAGTLSPSSAGTSPFAFTYTPAVSDVGKIVIITVTTNNPSGTPCVAGVGTYTLTVNAMPAAPVTGTITNVTCLVATGSVILNGLPSTGIWALTRNPGAVITNGTGTSTTVSGLAAGTYTFTITSAEGCISVSSAEVVISPPPSPPSAPVIGTITQPTCAISTGSVVLSGLPATGSWTLTRNPGGVTISGTGTGTTISALPSGTHTFTVTSSNGCTSGRSENVIVNSQPPIPAAPSIGTITPPTCTLSTGSVELTGLPSSGSWTLVRYPGTITTTGSGTSTIITGLSLGTYNYTVTTADGCLSTASANVVIPAQLPTPAAPIVGTITQPTFTVPTGSVVLSGLPSSGSWVITRLPGVVVTLGTGTSKTITDLEGGVFTFTVTNSYGCTSAESINVTISTPGAPVLIITNPSTVCSPAKVDLTSSKITVGSTPGLTYTYWTDALATKAYSTPTAATAGTYYIKGTTVSGYYNIKPVIVTIDNRPVANAGIDQILEYQFSTTLGATLIANETGIWSLVSGSGNFYSTTNPRTDVSDLSLGKNILLWTVTSGICPASSDTVKIVVNDFMIPTLITPNMDGRNEYFVLRGLSTLGKTELSIFDRRGALVYKSMNYDNSWNGLDKNDKALPEDTYYYVIKSENGKSLSGYIIIRR